MTKLLLFALNTLASEGASHTHGHGGEAEHLYPIIGIFAALVFIGIGIGWYTNKKN